MSSPNEGSQQLGGMSSPKITQLLRQNKHQWFVVKIEGATKKTLKGRPLGLKSEVTVTLTDKGNHYLATVVDGDLIGETFDTYPRQINRPIAGSVAETSGASVVSTVKSSPATSSVTSKSARSTSTRSRPTLSLESSMIPPLTDVKARPYKLRYERPVESQLPRSHRKRTSSKTSMGEVTTMAQPPARGIRLSVPDLTSDGGIPPKYVTNPMDSSNVYIGEPTYDTSETRDILVLSDEMSLVGSLVNYDKLFGVTGWQRLLDDGPLVAEYAFYLSGMRWTSVSRPSTILSLRNPPGLKSDQRQQCQTTFQTACRDTTHQSIRLHLKYPLLGKLTYWEQPIHQLDRSFLIQYLASRELDVDAVLTECGDMSLANLTLKRLLYAKFQNHQLLRDVLLSTHDAMLVKPIGDNNYHILHALMETRLYLKSDIVPIYYNKEYEQQQQIDTIERLKYLAGLREWITRTNTIPKFGEVETKLSDQIAQAIIDENMVELKSQLTGSQFNPGSSAGQGPSSGNVSPLPPPDSGAFAGKPSLSELLQEESKYRGFYYAQLQLINDRLSGEGMVAYDVPPNGDCLFYSIMDGLFQIKHPKLGGDGSYSQNITRISLSPFGGGIPVCVLEQASLQMRQDISAKIFDNRDKQYFESGFSVSDMVSQELLSEIGESDYQDVPDKLQGYLDLIQKSASSDTLSNPEDRRGIWGGDLEIWMAVALYGINIRKWVIGPTGMVRESETYRMEDARSVITEGYTVDPTEPTPTIDIVWVSLGSDNMAHFISTRPKSSQLRFQVDTDGNVRKFIGEECSSESGDTLPIGTEFQPQSGHYIPIETSPDETVTTSCSGLSDDGWENVEYYRQDEQVYYRGCYVGTYTEDVTTIVFMPNTSEK